MFPVNFVTYVPGCTIQANGFGHLVLTCAGLSVAGAGLGC